MLGAAGASPEQDGLEGEVTGQCRSNPTPGAGSHKDH